VAKKILIIDDDKDILTLLATRLKGAGYDVTTASDGQEGLEKLKSGHPDLILLDVIMPGIDGFEFFKIIKKDAKKAHIPVVIITARSGMKDSFLIMGAQEVLIKPFKSEELISVVNSAMSHTALVLGDDPYVNEKILTALKKFSIEAHVVGDEITMFKKGDEGTYKIIVAYLPLVKKEPTDFVSSLHASKNSGSKILLYCDAHVKGTEDNVTYKIHEVRTLWERAGIKSFFDSRLTAEPFADVLSALLK
jgi:CheY-like chemotaxis protein